MDTAGRFQTAAFLLCFLSFGLEASLSSRPHIIFIVADDLGWNDVSWHNPQMITPNLGRLARDGVILNSSYVQPLCSPSRNAFMSGMFPYHTGLQHDVIRALSPHGMPLNLTTLPQKLKTVGYSTHMVGKWHLGFCNWKYTPKYRGFDSFVGYFLAEEDYYNHTRMDGYDLRFNTSVYKAPVGTYSANVFGQRAVDVINTHDPNVPLFLYVPFQSVHSPLEVPAKYEEMYAHIQNKNRRVFSGMVTAMDEAIGNITDALERTGLLENSVIIFTTDNGGPVQHGANNWPLRGAKATLWEGGTKGSAFVYSKKYLNKTSYVNTEMIHAVDWYPTIVHLAGVDPEPGIDGVNQWSTVSEATPSPRISFVYNIDELVPNAAIRVGKYKLIQGEAGAYNDWYPPPTVDTTSSYDTNLYFQQREDSFRLYNIEGLNYDRQLLTNPPVRMEKDLTSLERCYGGFHMYNPEEWSTIACECHCGSYTIFLWAYADKTNILYKCCQGHIHPLPCAELETITYWRCFHIKHLAPKTDYNQDCRGRKKRERQARLKPFRRRLDVVPREIKGLFKTTVLYMSVKIGLSKPPIYS